MLVTSVGTDRRLNALGVHPRDHLVSVEALIKNYNVGLIGPNGIWGGFRDPYAWNPTQGLAVSPSSPLSIRQDLVKALHLRKAEYCWYLT